MSTMKRGSWMLWRGVILCAVLVLISVPADAQQASKSPGSSDSTSPPHLINPPGSTYSKDSAPAVLEFDVGGDQGVGGGIVATFSVMAQRPMDPVRIEIVLPDGVQKTAGELSWQGPIAGGEIRIVEISARLSTPGSKRFLGKVTLPPAAAGGAPQLLTVEKTFDVQPASPTTPKK